MHAEPESPVRNSANLGDRIDLYIVNRLAATPYRNKVQFILLLAFVTYVLASVVLGLVHQVSRGVA